MHNSCGYEYDFTGSDIMPPTLITPKAKTHASLCPLSEQHLYDAARLLVIVQRYVADYPN